MDTHDCNKHNTKQVSISLTKLIFAKSRLAINVHSQPMVSTQSLIKANIYIYLNTTKAKACIQYISKEYTERK